MFLFGRDGNPAPRTVHDPRCICTERKLLAKVVYVDVDKRSSRFSTGQLEDFGKEFHFDCSSAPRFFEQVLQQAKFFHRED